jgi:hypothetical protein
LSGDPFGGRTEPLHFSQGEEMTDDTTRKNDSPSFQFAASRWSKMDRHVGGWTLVYLVSLFLPWFSFNFGITGIHASLDGLWHGYMYFSLLASLAILVYLVLEAGNVALPFRMPFEHDRALFIGTGVNFVLALLSFLTPPGGWSRSWGAFIGVIVAAVAVAPFAIPAARKWMSEHKA